MSEDVMPVVASYLPWRLLRLLSRRAPDLWTDASYYKWCRRDAR
jgi:hypothetical protein